jgi:NitT/TauT family transport system substrate-binding protein
MTTIGAGRPFRRQAFLAATAAFAAAPLLARAQGLVKIRVGATVQDDIVGVLWASQSGIYQKYGLDVDVIRSNNGVAISAAVLSGSLEIGKGGALSTYIAHAKGVPILVEAPSAIYVSTAANVALVVAKTSRLQRGRDFNGKTVAVPALGDLFTLGISAWIDKNGGDAKSVKFLELPGAAQADAIAAGRVDAAALAEPLVTDAIRSGKCRFVAHPYDAIAPRFAATLMFASSDYAAKNVDVLARFRKGTAEGLTYALAHRSEMIPLLAKFTGIDPSVLASTSQTTIGTTLDPRLIQPVIDVAVKYGVLAKSFPAKDVIDPNA